jgi:hypothetical protein
MNSAKWHKSCRNLYSKMKLERLKKRKSVATVTDGIDESLATCPDVISDDDTSQYFTRSSSTVGSNMALHCIFCDKSETHGPLHQVTTFDVDCRVRNCAYALQDSSLLAKLSVGDLIAVEAHYHASCLISLYRRAATAIQGDAAINNSQHSGFANNESLAFAQLLEYIGEEKQDTSIAPVFKLPDLSKCITTGCNSLA